MDEWGRRESAGERIEIELTTVEPRTRSRHTTTSTTPSATTSTTGATSTLSDQPVAESGDRTHDESGGSQRRTVMITAASVGVVALVLGWALGRGSSADDGDAGDATPSASTIAVTTTERITDTIAPPPTTVRPRPSTTTTTTLPPGTPVEVLLAPELRALPYELAVTDYSGSVFRIDLPAATVRAYEGSRSQPPTVAFRPDGSLLTYSPWGDGTVPATITIDGTTTRLDNGRDPHQLIVDGDGGLWRYRYDAQTVELLDENMEPTGTSATVQPFMNPRPDPAGGILVSGSNGTYSIDASGTASRETTGDVVAAGVDTLIAYECDENMACTYQLVDRATGAKSPIDLDGIVASAPPLAADAAADLTRQIVPPGWFGNVSGASIVGRYATIGVQSQDAARQMGFLSNVVIDLDRLQATAHVELMSGNGIKMSDDGAWGFASGVNDEIVAIELATGRQMEFVVWSAEMIFDIAVRTK